MCSVNFYKRPIEITVNKASFWDLLTGKTISSLTRESNRLLVNPSVCVLYHRMPFSSHGSLVTMAYSQQPPDSKFTPGAVLTSTNSNFLSIIKTKRIPPITGTLRKYFSPKFLNQAILNKDPKSHTATNKIE